MLYGNTLKEIVVTEEEIKEICIKVRHELEEEYQDCETPIIFLGLLKGCHPFMTDLLRNINVPHVCDYMDVSSYFGNEKAVSEVQIIMDMSMQVQDRDIVIVEDIVESGRTIKKVIDLLMFRGAKSVKVATCTDKPSGRTVDLYPDFIGVTVPDSFLVGYGLDYKEEYRNMPCIGTLDEKFIK